MLYNSIRHNVTQEPFSSAVILEVLLLFRLLTWHTYGASNLHIRILTISSTKFTCSPTFMCDSSTLNRIFKYDETSKRNLPVHEDKLHKLCCYNDNKNNISIWTWTGGMHTKRNWYTYGFTFPDEILKRMPNVETTDVLPFVSVWPSITD